MCPLHGKRPKSPCWQHAPPPPTPQKPEGHKPLWRWFGLRHLPSHASCSWLRTRGTATRRGTAAPRALTWVGAAERSSNAHEPADRMPSCARERERRALELDFGDFPSFSTHNTDNQHTTQGTHKHTHTSSLRPHQTVHLVVGSLTPADQASRLKTRLSIVHSSMSSTRSRP